MKNISFLKGLALTTAVVLMGAGCMGSGSVEVPAASGTIKTNIDAGGSGDVNTYEQPIADPSQQNY